MSGLSNEKQFSTQQAIGSHQNTKEEVLQSLSIRKQIRILQDASNLVREVAVSLHQRVTEAPINEQSLLSLNERAEREYRARRARVLILGDHNLATGPAWDMLLDLFMNEQSRRRMSVTDATVAACCPGTTALRWLHVMSAAGLIEKEEDRTDSRRTFVFLSKEGKDKVKQCLLA